MQCALWQQRESLLCSQTFNKVKKNISSALLESEVKKPRLTWALQWMDVLKKSLAAWRNNSAAEQSAPQQSERPSVLRAQEEMKLWHKERCPITPFTLPQDVLRNKTEALFVSRVNLITARESQWEPLVWTLTPPFLSPSPSPQRATCALHNSLSQNKRQIWAAGRRMACLSGNETPGMTPWKRGRVVRRVPLAGNSHPPTDREKMDCVVHLEVYD